MTNTRVHHAVQQSTSKLTRIIIVATSNTPPCTPDSRGVAVRQSTSAPDQATKDGFGQNRPRQQCSHLKADNVTTGSIALRSAWTIITLRRVTLWRARCGCNLHPALPASRTCHTHNDRQRYRTQHNSGQDIWATASIKLPSSPQMAVSIR